MKKRRIGIDARLLYQTGVGVYLRNLLLHLTKIKDDSVEIVVFAKQSEWNRFINEYSLHPTFYILQPCSVTWHSFSEQIVFLRQLYGAKLDIVHFPYFSWPVLYFGPFVSTIHDTILLKHATGRATTLPVVWYYIKSLVFRFVFWQQVMRSKTVFVPSNAVASELEEYYPNIKGKIVVTHEGVDEVFAKSVSQKPQDMNLQEKSYLLYVGNCYPHKNVEILLKAISQSKEQRVGSKGVLLVLVGPKSIFADNLREKFKAIEDNILWLHDVKTTELKWLYVNAKALVFPSKAEGFGLPILEALSVGCPLILSDIPVFHEVAGENAIYFDSGKAEYLSTMLSNSLNNTTSLAGSSVADDFSFEKMAEITVSYYKK